MASVIEAIKQQRNKLDDKTLLEIEPYLQIAAALVRFMSTHP